MELFYHSVLYPAPASKMHSAHPGRTATVLKLRKLLDPALPEHRAIIDKSDAVVQDGAVLQKFDCNQGHPPSLASTAALTGRAGNKREHTEGRLAKDGRDQNLRDDNLGARRTGASHQQQQSVCIDLTTDLTPAAQDINHIDLAGVLSPAAQEIKHTDLT